MVFTLGELRCAAPAEQVAQVEILDEVAPLPHVPAWLLGVTHLRGEIVSVIDLRAFLGMGGSLPEDPRIMVIQGLEGDTAAFIVDHIVGVSPLGEKVSALSKSLDPRLAPFAEGPFEFEGEPLFLTDLKALLSSQPLAELDSSLT